MVVNRGYTVNAPNTSLVDFVGLLNNGIQNSGTLGYNGTDGGWHLLGNPYPAPLDGVPCCLAAHRHGAGHERIPEQWAVWRFLPHLRQRYWRLAADCWGIGLPRAGEHGNGVGSVNLTNSNRITTFGTQPVFGRGTADTRPQLQLLLRGTHPR